LKSEVDFLPQVFVGMNENFVSVAIEGVVAMADRGDSIDLEALRRVTTSCGADVLTGALDVKKTTRDWWHPFGYKAALSTTEVKQAGK
jgi:hypothetical protein